MSSSPKPKAENLAVQKQILETYADLGSKRNDPELWVSTAHKMLEHGDALRAKAVLETLDSSSPESSSLDTLLLLVRACLQSKPGSIEEAVTLSR